YLMMIIVVYATLGVFLLIASRNPYAHKSLIWFTVWSSAVHGAIMGVQALSDTAERGHLVGDAPALILVAIILAVLMPRTAQASACQTLVSFRRDRREAVFLFFADVRFWPKDGVIGRRLLWIN